MTSWGRSGSSGRRASSPRPDTPWRMWHVAAHAAPASAIDAEGAAHERVHAAEVRVGAGPDGPRRLPGDPLRRRGAALGPEAEVAGVEPDRPVRERVGDPRGAV